MLSGIEEVSGSRLRRTELHGRRLRAVIFDLMTAHPDSCVTWLGHAGFMIRTPSSTTILVDPWLEAPSFPDEFRGGNLPRPDVILVTHGHFDHASSTPPLLKQSGARAVAVYEVGEWIKAQGVAEDRVIQMNKGGTVQITDEIAVTMVYADHSSSCPGQHDLSTGGASAGFVINIKDCPTIYHAGDTNVFGDMHLISELYQPKVALLPIGGHFTMGPMEAAYALNKLLVSVQTVIPMHYGTFPLLKGTPDELNAQLQRRVTVRSLSPGASIPMASILH